MTKGILYCMIEVMTNVENLVHKRYDPLNNVKYQIKWSMLLLERSLVETNICRYRSEKS